MTELNLKYSSSLSTDISSFKLIELPPELLKVLESATDQFEPARFVDSRSWSRHTL